MAEDPGGGGVLTFDPVLLQGGSDRLLARPDQPALNMARQMAGSIQPTAFGEVPGAAEAAARVQEWVSATTSELERVAVDVVDLGQRAATAAQMARDVDPETAEIARGATPDEAAARIGSPEYNLSGGTGD